MIINYTVTANDTCTTGRERLPLPLPGRKRDCHWGRTPQRKLGLLLSLYPDWEGDAPLELA